MDFIEYDSEADLSDIKAILGDIRRYWSPQWVYSVYYISLYQSVVNFSLTEHYTILHVAVCYSELMVCMALAEDEKQYKITYLETVRYSNLRDTPNIKHRSTKRYHCNSMHFTTNYILLDGQTVLMMPFHYWENIYSQLKLLVLNC